MPTKTQQDLVDTLDASAQTSTYDLSTYGSDNPNYVDIMVDKSNRSTQFSRATHSDVLDNPNDNTAVGKQACSNVNICVPTIHVPDATKQLANELTIDANGNKVTELDKEVAAQIRSIADSIDTIPDASLLTTDKLKVGDIDFTRKADVEALGYGHVEAQNLQDLKDTKFADLTQIAAKLITNENTNCRPETEYTIPAPKSTHTDTELDGLMDKLKDLIDTVTDPSETVTAVSNEDLTERLVDGKGTFDWLASALFNQLDHSRNKGLINSDDVAQIYTQGLSQAMQTSTQFVLQNNQTYWQNQIARSSLANANVQALISKAQLIMMPYQLKLAYAQLQAENRKLDLLEYQIEVQKLQIPLTAAQVDQTREQTALICVQKKLAMEQLAQAELDRKLKQAQIQRVVFDIKSASLDIEIKQAQVDQANIATQTALVQLDQGKEQIKVINTQWQQGLKQLKLTDVQIKHTQAQIKAMAQQLLRDKEQTALIKAQTATAYAQITATSEQIKAMKAQYSDTIDGVEVGGVLGAQIAVNKIQAECFDRDSFYKFLTQLQSGWSAKKTSDIATLSPNGFTAFGLDRAINWYATKYFNMPENVFDLPSDYTDYLTDEQMDGTERTPSTGSAKVK